MKYKYLALAGSFDRLHKGHRFFISQAFKFGDKVLIGLTSDSFAGRKIKAQNFNINLKVKPYNERKKELENFLKDKKLLERTKIVEINDIYGPSLKDIDIEALAMTEETREGAEKVNIRRRQLTLPPLKILEIPLILAEDKKRISSTRIRIGEIDRWGKVFFSLSVFGRKIPAKLRLNLKKPLGLLISGNEQTIRKKVLNLLKSGNFSLIIAVGDEATTYLNKLGEQADVSVIDYHIQRKRVKYSLADFDFPQNFLKAKYPEKIIKAANPPGFVTKGLVLAVFAGIKKFLKDGRKRLIEVAGEEDLAGLPAILLAPLDSLILYGQPNQGIVAVKSTEEKKNKILELINGN